MRHFKKILILGCLVGAMLTSSRAQTISFHFIAPIPTINASFGGGDTTRMPAGYSRVLITAANSATFLTVASNHIRYVYTQLQTGTTLRTQVERVLNNSGRIVDVNYLLVNDSTGFSGAKTHAFLPYPQTAPFFVWPAATNNGPLANGRYNGWVMLGEHQMATDQSRRIGGMRAVDELVLHETSHTQWVGEWTKWPSTSAGAITYGADGQHYVTEVIGDQEGAINEGLATYYGFTINQAGMDTMLRHYSSPYARFFIEVRSARISDPIIRATPSVQDTLREQAPDGSIRIFRYPDGLPGFINRFQWRDLNGWYLLFAETTSTAFYSLYWRNAYSNRDTAFSFIGASAFSMHNGRRQRFLTYSANRLALKMEEYNATATGRADTGKTSSMLPYAILDLVTHFGMTDSVYRADHNQHYPDRNPRAFNEYFTNHRTAVRALVNADLAATPIRFLDAMARIRTYFRQPATIF